jgi:hypothetical protein
MSRNIFVSLEKLVMSNIEQILKGITETIKDQGVVKIILFGSYADIPIDMLVYTKLMYQKLQESGSLFTREINQKGKVLYEAFLM